MTSWTRLRTDALAVERWNRLHPDGRAPACRLITAALGSGPTPVVAVTDYMRAVPDQVARFVDRPFVSLGTDGFGRSDTRAALRSYFEVDAAHLVVAVLHELARTGDVEPEVVAEAIAEFGIDAARVPRSASERRQVPVTAGGGTESPAAVIAGPPPRARRG